MRPRGWRKRVLSERSSPEPGHNPGEMLLRGKATEWGLKHLMRVFGKVSEVGGGSEETEAGWGWGDLSGCKF